MSARTRLFRFLSLLGVGLGVLIFVLVLCWRGSEPSYLGKSLSQWLVPFCRETKKGLDAPGGPEHLQELQPVREAVKAIGTNALPYLMARLNHQESALHHKLRLIAAKQPYQAFRLENPDVGRIRAIRALAVLGPLAEPAAPVLERQLGNPALTVHALYALRAIGPAGLQAVVNQLTNASMAVRLQAGIAILSQAPSFPQFHSSGQVDGQVSSVLVSGLTQMARDPGSTLRLPALNRLMSMGTNASEVVPALLPLVGDSSPMVRQIVIYALGRMHAQSDLLIPALTNALEDSDVGTRMAAYSVLRGLGYPAPMRPPTLGEFSRPTPPFARAGTNFLVPPRPLRSPVPPSGFQQ